LARHKPLVFMFSGQGSHYYQMGRELYEEQPHFRAWMLKGDRRVQETAGFSVLEHVYDPRQKKGDPFTRTLFTHPAIFMVEYSLAQTLRAAGVEPDYVLGASMGGFAALAVAGVLTFEQALQAVIEQARYLEASCRPGGMLAVLENPALFDQTPWLYRQSVLAGVNFDKHFVISAGQPELSDIEQALKQTPVTTAMLPVSYAFHSPLIDPAMNTYCDFLQTLVYSVPQTPLICCTYATALSDIPENYLWTIIREPIRFQKTIASMEAEQSWTYLDLGPSGTLATFVKYNLPAPSASDIFSIMTLFGHELSNLDKLLKTQRFTYQSPTGF
jgi:trans-AT polyketide synthase/acyltransferase/oxidoreductase domain-containing protein